MDHPGGWFLCRRDRSAVRFLSLLAWPHGHSPGGSRNTTWRILSLPEATSFRTSAWASSAASSLICAPCPSKIPLLVGEIQHSKAAMGLGSLLLRLVATFPVLARVALHHGREGVAGAAHLVADAVDVDAEVRTADATFALCSGARFAKGWVPHDVTPRSLNDSSATPSAKPAWMSRALLPPSVNGSSEGA